MLKFILDPLDAKKMKKKYFFMQKHITKICLKMQSLRSKKIQLNKIIFKNGCLMRVDNNESFQVGLLTDFENSKNYRNSCIVWYFLHSKKNFFNRNEFLISITEILKLSIQFEYDFRNIRLFSIQI
jgi:hypothetical protein